MCYITQIDFCMLTHPCILGINPTWSWYTILLKCSLVWFVSALLRIFTSTFMIDSGLQFSFLMVTFSAFGIIVVLASKNELEVFPLIFWRSLRRIGVNSFLNIWQNSVKPSCSGLLLVRRFSITYSVSSLVIHLFRFSISS